MGISCNINFNRFYVLVKYNQHIISKKYNLHSVHVANFQWLSLNNLTIKKSVKMYYNYKRWKHECRYELLVICWIIFADFIDLNTWTYHQIPSFQANNEISPHCIAGLHLSFYTFEVKKLNSLYKIIIESLHFKTKVVI